MSSSNFQASGISEDKSTLKTLISSEPEFVIFKEPIDSTNPKCLLTEIDLPGVSSQKEIMLDVGEDRLVCEAKSNKHKYILDIFLPYRLNQEDCEAQFHREKYLLKVKIPVLSKDM